MGIAFILMSALFIQGFEAFRPGPYVPLSMERNNFYVAFLYAQGMGANALLAGVFPLVIALASGDSLVWDKKSGYEQHQLMRISYNRYILGKLFGASIISFGFVFVSELLAFTYGMIMFPGVVTLKKILGITPDYAADLFINHPFLYVLLIILNTALFGMVISLLSMLISTFVKNVYVVIAVPWLLFFVLQFVFYAINLSKFAPLDLVGMYMSSSFQQYSTLEIPLTRISLWLILFISTYLAYIRKFKVGVRS